MKGTTTVFFLCFLLWSFSGSDKHHPYAYNGKDYSVKTSMLDGRYDGLYTSWYTNGKKKAEGKFSNNMRVGKWTVWDSTGKVKMIREYNNNFDYKRIFPAYPDGPAKLFEDPQEKPEYNKQGFLEYVYLEERAVSISKRIWRFIPARNNSILFENERLFKVLQTASLNGTAWLFEDEEFRKKMSLGMLQSVNGDTIDFQNDSLAGFKIKEDWFFDNKRMLGETRIIGICPVFYSRKDSSDKDAGWFYYNQLRPLLAKEKISGKEIPLYIHSLDDLFFFRYFYGEIYKESNVYDRALKEYANGLMLKQERDRIEYSLIELEHDMWLRIAP